jgi:hypothetical protein
MYFSSFFAGMIMDSFGRTKFFFFLKEEKFWKLPSFVNILFKASKEVVNHIKLEKVRI